jgi:hypothetical protein
VSFTVHPKDLADAFNRFLAILPAESMGTGTRNLSITSMNNLLSVYRSGLIPEFKKVTFDENLYPTLPDRDEKTVDSMRRYLSTKGKLNRNAMKELENNALAFLLYSVLWKNGDRNKFGPIMHGLAGRDIDNKRHKKQLKNVCSNSSYVFFQFGRHLQDKQQPIIDQHSVRAHVFLTEFDSKRPVSISANMANNLRRKYSQSRFDKPNQGQYKAYLKWIQGAVAHSRDRDHKEKLLPPLDKIMYSLGKAIKSTD